MKNKPLKLREESGIDLSLKNLVAIIIGVSMGIFAYTELTARLVSLETSRELFQADLLKNLNSYPLIKNSTCF